MGNCASKKSAKSLKFSAARKKIFQSKMEKDYEIHSKGASKKVVPLTKGEIKSFGFKKKAPSQLPIPVTLISNSFSNSFLDINENNNNSGTKQNNSSEGYQSGSSVESLCHAPVSSTSKTMQKKPSRQQNANQPFQQNISNNPSKKGSGLIQEKNSLKNKETFICSPEINSEQHSGALKNLSDPLVNRFGFRLSTSPKPTNSSGKNLSLPPNRNTYPIEQKPLDTNSVYSNQPKTLNFSTRSRSEGSRDSCQQNLKASHSNQSRLNGSESFLPSELHPKKFTLQTSHLPKLQFPVRVFDSKTAKTAANYYRKEGIHKESNPSKEALCNKNYSVIESHSKSEKVLEKNVKVLENSPGAKVRRTLPSQKGKKLGLKVVGNKFELLKDDEEKDSNVVTEISFIKLPSFSTNKGTAVINTGLVEERTNQYLKRISYPFAIPKKEIDDVYRTSTKNSYTMAKTKSGNEISRWDERCGAESEEEKSFKDSRKSEKFLNVEGCADVDDAMLPGEAMAEDESLCFNFEYDLDPSLFKKKPEKTGFQCATDEAPNTIRLDALRLSKELKYKTFASSNKNKQPQKNEKLSSIVVHLANDGPDEETFPSESILEQLSSDSDSLGDKGENKNNDKEKNFKVRNLNLNLEDLETELDVNMVNRRILKESDPQTDTDVDDDELDRNLDEANANMDEEKLNCLEISNSSSPGTPTNTSNSLSLSEGRDFLIDDEIADQPQLYFSEKFMEIVNRDEEKTSNEKLFMHAKDSGTCSDSKASSPGDGDKTFKKVTNDISKDMKIHEKKEKKGSKLNSEGTLSPCESITSDDLMLDFESNSFEEVAERLDGFTNGNTNIGAPLNDVNQKNVSSQIFHKRSENQKSSTMKEESRHCSPTKNHLNVSSPRGSFRSKEDDDFVKIDRISYQDVFQDVVSMKAMLLNLKCLLSKSEGSVQENSTSHMENGFIDNNVEDELADLKRQVLFLQQQLEEREKTVQILKLKVSKTLECSFETGTTESREQCNAATQTGLDQFQKDFARFRLFQTTPVV